MLSGMQKHPKRPRDPNQLGKLIVDLSVGDIEEMSLYEGKNIAAVALGQKGGKARAEALSPKERSCIAKAAAKARWTNKGKKK